VLFVEPHKLPDGGTMVVNCSCVGSGVPQVHACPLGVQSAGNVDVDVLLVELVLVVVVVGHSPVRGLHEKM
jgi:hypothetical protein